MIRVTLIHNDDKHLEAVEVEGHAGFADHGHDIVCAAVSGITLGLVYAAQDLLGLRIYEEVADEGGYLRCRVPSGLDPDKEEQVRFILETMASALRSVADEYDSFVMMVEETM